MKRILCIETATETCSVCIAEDRKILSSKTSHENKSHASLLTVFIEEILSSNNLKAIDLDAVAVSMGPGSYTGLRIGVSAAKGIAYGSGIPLISVSTLQAMATGMLQNVKLAKTIKKNDLFVPMIDARRMEVYSALYDNIGNLKTEISAEIIDENSYAKELNTSTLYFFGNGAIKCRDIIQSQNAIFESNFEMLADNMVEIAFNKFEMSQFEDVAYFEPYYLKDFVAKKSKNILNQIINNQK